MFRRDSGSKMLENLAAYRATKGGSGAVTALELRYRELRHLLWTIRTSSDIDRDAKIAVSVRLPHPNGIVIHRDAVIAEDCMIQQQVTIGQADAPGAPRLERGVYVGAGAKLLGQIVVGEGARIGANAVVLQDVPAGSTAVGVPARIIERGDRERPQAAPQRESGSKG